MRFSITLGDGVRVSPAAYLSALHIALANPSQSFDRSLNDRWPATGAEIIDQWRRMIRGRWSDWTPSPGKGNRARRRAEAIADARATCKWCGKPTGSNRKRFCDDSCARSYSS